MSKKTECECPMAGYCERHGVQKSKHLHTLCQNHQGYFNMWEQCRGPNQNPNDCLPKVEKTKKIELQEEQEKGEQTLPSTMTMAKNFVSSAAKHVASGFNFASDEEKERRLAICAECPHIVNNTRCGKCGCVLKTKAGWATSSCPIGKW
tara:strand:+ start:177 stop:623 length:447 start_codon:yes stop_codon:yes gene_type:complete